MPSEVLSEGIFYNFKNILKQKLSVGVIPS